MPPPGTIDGQGAFVNDGSCTAYELSHPLDSADDAHDFRLGPGDTVGFTLFLSMIAGQNLADTEFPSALVGYAFGDIVIALANG